MPRNRHTLPLRGLLSRRTGLAGSTIIGVSDMITRRQMLGLMGLGTAGLVFPGMAGARGHCGRHHRRACPPPCEHGPLTTGTCDLACPISCYAVINNVYYYYCMCCSPFGQHLNAADGFKQTPAYPPCPDPSLCIAISPPDLVPPPQCSTCGEARGSCACGAQFQVNNGNETSSFHLSTHLATTGIGNVCPPDQKGNDQEGKCKWDGDVDYDVNLGMESAVRRVRLFTLTLTNPNHTLYVGQELAQSGGDLPKATHSKTGNPYSHHVKVTQGGVYYHVTLKDVDPE